MKSAKQAERMDVTWMNSTCYAKQMDANCTYLEDLQNMSRDTSQKSLQSEEKLKVTANYFCEI